ncbi:hypothetical protein X747_31860 [Mesorhizobium sp. LNJC384A00]|nr:hypothetical protein X747_31860 [Mesorhizobium sp. LNJC384A00]
MVARAGLKHDAAHIGGKGSGDCLGEQPFSQTTASQVLHQAEIDDLGSLVVHSVEVEQTGGCPVFHFGKPDRHLKNARLVGTTQGQQRSILASAPSVCSVMGRVQCR